MRAGSLFSRNSRKRQREEETKEDIRKRKSLFSRNGKERRDRDILFSRNGKDRRDILQSKQSLLLSRSIKHKEEEKERRPRLSMFTRNYEGKETLVTMIAKHYKESVIDDGYKCGFCKKKDPCTKKMIIQKFPKILVIHLNRFGSLRLGSSQF